MDPVFSVRADRVRELTREFEDIYTTLPMTRAVTLIPCGHTANEDGVHMAPGFNGNQLHEPGEALNRITRVRVVSHVNCPECRAPVSEYIRNWAMRSAATRFLDAFQQVDGPVRDATEAEIKFACPDPSPSPYVVHALPIIPAHVPVAPAPVAPAPIPAAGRRVMSFKERFAFAVSTALGLLGSTLGAYLTTNVPVKTTLFGFGKKVYDTTARDNNALVALFSSVVAATFIATAAYVLTRRT